MTGDQDCAAEATQEAFLRAFERFGTLREPEKFSGWVGAIAINLARDIYRRRRREVLSDAQMLEAVDQLETDGDPGDRMCGLEQVQILREAVSKLPLDSRAVVVMHYLQEQGIGDIARALGIPEGTVKSRLYHARLLLRKMVEPDPEQDEFSNKDVTPCFGDVKSGRGALGHEQR